MAGSGWCDVQPALQELALGFRRRVSECRFGRLALKQRVIEPLKSGLGLCGRHSVAQAREDLYPPKPPALEFQPLRRQLGFHGDRDVHVRPRANIEAIKTVAHDANNLEWMTIQVDTLTDCLP